MATSNSSITRRNVVVQGYKAQSTKHLVSSPLTIYCMSASDVNAWRIGSVANTQDSTDFVWSVLMS